MKKNPFQGLGVALITPFHADGSVDEAALCRLVDELIGNGADFLCVLGTTAETPTLSAAEYARIAETVCQRTAGRIPLLLGAGGNNTAAVCEAVSRAPQGFDGVLIVAPYYNKPSQEGLFQHFQAVAEASRLPVVLYNIPGRTGVNLTAQTTLRIARECPKVVAIKEASGNLEQIAAIQQGAPEGFGVLSGDDGLAFELIRKGAAGVISVVGNAYPALFARMVHAAQAGDLAEAKRLDDKFRPLYKTLFADGNPSGIKCLLSLQGKCSNTLRLPLVGVSPETERRLREEML